MATARVHDKFSWPNGYFVYKILNFGGVSQAYTNVFCYNEIILFTEHGEIKMANIPIGNSQVPFTTFFQ